MKMNDRTIIGGEDFTATDDAARAVIDHLANTIDDFDEGWHTRQPLRVLVNMILKAERAIEPTPDVPPRKIMNGVINAGDLGRLFGR